jgi:hypothetical protein
MKIIKNVTIGADPELFIYNKKINKVVSSIGIIPGVKGDPYKDGLPDGFGLQIDNILGEFNVPPVSVNSCEDFVGNIEYAKSFIKEYIKKINPDLDILCKASMFVDNDQLKSEEALLFGCSEDYNVYTMSANPKPEGDKTNLRTTGFHIHIGYSNPDISTSCLLVKYLDAILGVSSILMDDDTERRKLYGKAGCFRLTTYGVEYRVLSGALIATKELIENCFYLVSKAIKAYNNQLCLPPEDKILNAINNGEKTKAIDILSKYYPSAIEIVDKKQ